MAWYKTGTVSVTNGSAAVVGVDTLWLTQAAAGDLFTLDGAKFYEVLSITDNTHLTLASVYTGATLSAQAYAIIRNFTSTTNAALALSLADMINKWHLSLDELLTWLTSLGSVNLTNPATGAAVSVKTPSQIQAEWIGTLSKAITTADVPLTATEASNAFIKATGALTANRAMIFPATQGHVIAFENSTTGAYILTVKTAAGTGIVVAQGERVLLFCDGTNIVNAFTAAPGINAADVTNTPAGGIIATTVQAALNELDSEKAPLVSPSFTTPALDTPTSGNLSSCVSNTETENNNSTQLATTAYADRLTNGTLPVSATSISALIATNPSTLSADLTIPSFYNAYSAGPLTIGEGVDVTIGDNANWTIL